MLSEWKRPQHHSALRPTGLKKIREISTSPGKTKLRRHVFNATEKLVPSTEPESLLQDGRRDLTRSAAPPFSSRDRGETSPPALGPWLHPCGRITSSSKLRDNRPRPRMHARVGAVNPRSLKSSYDVPMTNSAMQRHKTRRLADSFAARGRLRTPQRCRSDSHSSPRLEWAPCVIDSVCQSANLCDVALIARGQA